MHLSRPIDRVEQGETVILARGGDPVARLEPIAALGERALGFVAYRLPDSFFDALPEEDLRGRER